jgi:hypothetical protein
VAEVTTNWPPRLEKEHHRLCPPNNPITTATIITASRSTTAGTTTPTTTVARAMATGTSSRPAFGIVAALAPASAAAHPLPNAIDRLSAWRFQHPPDRLCEPSMKERR